MLDDGAHTTLERWGERGRAILCIHGMTSSRKSWQQLAEHYQTRARIYAYDQRGHGDSADVTGPMTLHRSLLDLRNVMDAIGHGVDTLIGHSWGGAVAILGGRRFDVARVVAIDPMIRQADAAWYDRFLAELRQSSGNTAPIERLRDENPPPAWDLRRDLERYPKPLFLALADGTESMVDRDDLKYVRERGGPNVGLRVFQGQGHSLQRTDFERFTRELDAFIAAG